MTQKQIKLRGALLALYLEVPSEVAQSVTNVVMDAVGESDEILKQARAALLELRAYDQDFSERTCPGLLEVIDDYLSPKSVLTPAAK